MDFSWIWRAVLIVLVGSALLRVAGRKSIAQMTVAQTIIMIAIGTLLIQPVSERSLPITFATALVLVLTLLGMEYIQVKFDLAEGLITGRAVLVIENGVLNTKALAKIRMTVDQLEIQLRQANIANLTDVQWATVEPNGRLGYSLMDHAQPATKQDIQMLVDLVNAKIPGGGPFTSLPVSGEHRLFTEIQNPTTHHPKQLQ